MLDQSLTESASERSNSVNDQTAKRSIKSETINKKVYEKDFNDCNDGSSCRSIARTTAKR